MKKILLASTILVGSAGIAAADIAISGDAEFGITDAGAGFAFSYDAGIDFTMTGETDGGLGFGAKFGIDARDAAVDDATVWVEGEWGKLTVGDVDTAVEAVVGGIADIGWDGLGVDDVAEALRGDGTADILYTHTFGDISLGASFDTGDTGGTADDWAVAAGYTLGDYKVALGFLNDNGTESYFVSAGATFGDFGVNALYSDTTAGSNAAFGVDVSYTMGAIKITAAGARDSAGAGQDAFGIGASYDLGGGMSVSGGVADVAGTTVMDLGVKMKF